MKKILLILCLFMPVWSNAQNCDWQQINFKKLHHERLILTAPDEPFFPISDVILNKNTWKIKVLHGKYSFVPVKKIGNNVYRFNLRANQFALMYPNYQNDKNFSQYQKFSRGDTYTAKLFYKHQSCHEVDYMEIDVMQKQNGKIHQLKQKFFPTPYLVRYG